MTPLKSIMLNEVENTEYYDKTYKVLLNKDFVSGYVYEIEAVKQAIYFMLSTERYKHPIYSWDYGVELFDLIGQPMSYVQAEFRRRIEDALTQDDRIESCTDFQFEMTNKSTLHASFTVNTVYGVLYAEMGVSV